MNVKLYCLALFYLLMGGDTNGVQAQKKPAGKTGGCDYQTIAGLAEITRIEKVLGKDSSALQYDEYAVFFTFTPKDGNQLMANLRDQELEFFLHGSGEQFRVGPKYIKQYQLRKGTKYAMKFLQSPACEVKYKLGEQGGMPNDIFEAEPNIAELKKRRLAEQLTKMEGNEPDPVVVPTVTNKMDSSMIDSVTGKPKTKKQLEMEAKRAKELAEKMAKDSAELKRKAQMEDNRNNGFRRMEEARNKENNQPPTSTDPDPEQPFTPLTNNSTVSEASIKTQPEPDPKETNPLVVPVSNPSTPKFVLDTTPVTIDEEKLRAALEAKILREMEMERQAKAKAEAERKRIEDEKNKKEAAKQAKIKAKEDEARRKVEEKAKKEAAERLKVQQAAEAQARQAEEARLIKELEDKIRAELIEKEKARLAAIEAEKLKQAEEERLAAEALKAEEAKAEAEQKLKELELKRSECVFQTKVAGVIQIVSVKKINEAAQSRLGYAEYEVRVKFTPSNIEDLPKNNRAIWQQEHTFVLDPLGRNANPNAAYIRKYSVFNNARFNGFAQSLESGVCNPLIMFSPQLPNDPAQIQTK